MTQNDDLFSLLQKEYEESKAKTEKLEKMMRIYLGKDFDPASSRQEATNESKPKDVREDDQKRQGVDLVPETYAEMAILIGREDFKGVGLTSRKIADEIVKRGWRKEKDGHTVLKRVSSILKEKKTDFIDTGDMNSNSKVYRLSDKHLKQSGQ